MPAETSQWHIRFPVQVHIFSTSSSRIEKTIESNEGYTNIPGVRDYTEKKIGEKGKQHRAQKENVDKLVGDKKDKTKSNIDADEECWWAIESANELDPATLLDSKDGLRLVLVKDGWLTLNCKLSAPFKGSSLILMLSSVAQKLWLDREDDVATWRAVHDLPLWVGKPAASRSEQISAETGGGEKVGMDIEEVL